MLRTLHRSADLGAVAAELGVAPDLARLAPELFPAAVDPTGEVSGEDRFRIFDAVVRLLSALTGSRPVLAVLDDAQWADPGSLLLLRHVAHGLDRERLLVLVNHRDTGPVPAVLATELLREPWTWPVDVRGLAAPDVARQLGALVGRDVPEGEAARVHARTGGNPFFVGEVGRIALDDGHRDDPVPASVREAIGSRIARLPPTTAKALRAAAIVGHEFRVTVVAATLHAPVLDCLAALEEAASAGLVEPLPTPEEAAGGRVEAHLADLARHWAVAAVAGDRSQAGAWIGRAADEAVRRLAYEEAGRLYRLVLEVAADEIDDAERCRILLAVGGALRLADHEPGRVEACLEAAALARRLGRPDLLAEAAVTLEDGDADLAYEVRVRELCEEALGALGPAPTRLRARVAANLSNASMYLADTEAAAPASAPARRGWPNEPAWPSGCRTPGLEVPAEPARMRQWRSTRMGPRSVRTSRAVPDSCSAVRPCP